MKRGRPPKGIERAMEDLVPLDRRIPDSPEFIMIEGVRNHEARLCEADDLSGRPLRDQEAFRAYLDFVGEFGFEPTKPRLKRFILDGRGRYRDAPGEDDLKGWTRLWKNSGLAYLDPSLPDLESQEFIDSESGDFNA